MHGDIAKSNGAMVPLEHEWSTFGTFLARHTRGGWPVHFDVFMDRLSVQFDFDELCFFGSFAICVKAGSAKVDDVFIPRSRFGLSIGFGRGLGAVSAACMSYWRAHFGSLILMACNDQSSHYHFATLKVVVVRAT